MACCILTAAAIGLVLAIKAKLLAGRGRDGRTDALAWRLRRIGDDGAE
jgi:hypothetical protein